MKITKHIQHLIGLYRQAIKSANGFVVLYAGEVTGWKSALDNPEAWRTGCVAVSASYECFRATGDNGHGGAIEWRQVGSNARKCSMVSGLPITGRQAIEKFTKEKLIGCPCVAVSVVLGDGSVNMVFGVIVDPADCSIDEPDDSVLFVEYHAVDDWYVTGIAADEQIVLLNMVADVTAEGVVV